MMTRTDSGVLYPAAQLVINKDGQIEFQLRKNHWRLVNIIDWNQAGAPKLIQQGRISQ
jgi:hypothetical protein